MAPPLTQGIRAPQDRSMSPPGIPMRVPVGILVLVISLIFAFSYYSAPDWYIGVIVAMVGVSIVVLMFIAGEYADQKHHRPSIIMRLDRTLFLAGAIVATGGMALMLVAGGALSGFALTVVVLLGVGLLVCGVFMFIMSLRS